MNCVWGLGSCNWGSGGCIVSRIFIGFHQPGSAWKLLPGVVYILSGDCGVGGGGMKSASGRANLREKVSFDVQ